MTQLSHDFKYQPTISLSSEQIEAFHRDGFLSVPQISTPEEIEMMREAYDRIFSSEVGRADGNKFDLAGDGEEGKTQTLPQILGPEQYAPELWDTQARANALHIVRQLFGPQMAVQGSHAIFKPAQHGATTPWHQDEAYWNPDFEYQSVSVWMPLQDVDEENGCMQFISGSHQSEILAHQPIGNNPKIHGLELSPEANADVSNPTICPLSAGGCTLHPSRTLHFTAANNSLRPRRAFIMIFGAPTVSREELGLPKRRFPWKEKRQTL